MLSTPPVLLIPEILELILLEVPVLELFKCRQVCRTWKDLLESSPFLSYYTQTGLKKDKISTAIKAEKLGEILNPTPLGLAVLQKFWSRVLLMTERPEFRDRLSDLDNPDNNTEPEPDDLLLAAFKDLQNSFKHLWERVHLFIPELHEIGCVMSRASLTPASWMGYETRIINRVEFCSAFPEIWIDTENRNYGRPGSTDLEDAIEGLCWMGYMTALPYKLRNRVAHRSPPSMSSPHLLSQGLFTSTPWSSNLSFEYSILYRTDGPLAGRTVESPFKLLKINFYFQRDFMVDSPWDISLMTFPGLDFYLYGPISDLQLQML
ncbi:hypothetical protein ABW19_dt0200222 [Dactylella cylindrospora]|nr:hypothetical protein ABW19_dt0200222 [Dactylella cylindrospora]